MPIWKVKEIKYFNENSKNENDNSVIGNNTSPRPSKDLYQNV